MRPPPPQDREAASGDGDRNLAAQRIGVCVQRVEAVDLPVLWLSVQHLTLLGYCPSRQPATGRGVHRQPHARLNGSGSVPAAIRVQPASPWRPVSLAA